MKPIALTLPNGQALIIIAENVASVRDATESERRTNPNDEASSRVTTVADFHLVRESVAMIWAKIIEDQK